MPPTTIHEAPALDSFTPLADHQSQTPTSFYGAKPVLHFQAAGTRAIAPRDQVSKLRFFADSEQEPTASDESSDRPIRVGTVDAYISSANLILFNHATSVGLLIPYPSISLHAIQRLKDPADTSVEVQGLYMQIELSNATGEEDDEEEMDPVELTLILPPPASDGTADSIQALFEAVSNCSNLHPDPASQDDDEEMGEDGSDSRIIFEGNVGYEGISGLPGVQQGSTDGGLPPPFPGSGGWITAENVSEYFDEDGNWIGGADGQGEGEGEVLGEGAGRVRTREEVEVADEGEKVNGDGGHEADDHKRVRND